MLESFGEQLEILLRSESESDRERMVSGYVGGTGGLKCLLKESWMPEMGSLGPSIDVTSLFDYPYCRQP